MYNDVKYIVLQNTSKTHTQCHLLIFHLITGSQIQPESNISYTGAIAVSVIIPSLFTFAIGLVIGAVITYCFTKRQQNDQIDVIEQPDSGPVYDEVSPTSVKTEKFEMGENMAYGPTTVRH